MNMSTNIFIILKFKYIKVKVREGINSLYTSLVSKSLVIAFNIIQLNLTNSNRDLDIKVLYYEL